MEDSLNGHLMELVQNHAVTVHNQELDRAPTLNLPMVVKNVTDLSSTPENVTSDHVQVSENVQN